MENNLSAVILAGGLGLRMRGYNDTLPKALVKIGDMPVIMHVMKIYSKFNINKFVVCTGHKGYQIEEYFSNRDDMEVICVDTGENTPTGGRLKKIESFISSDNFFMTYCDGVADINMGYLYDTHLRQEKIATLTAVHPMSPFGIVEISNGNVISFKEKPMLEGFINGGFFVFNADIFNILKNDSNLEEEILKELVTMKQLAAYVHNGFWACMDTPKDVDRLNKLWDTGRFKHFDVDFNKPPWKLWDD